MGSIGFAIGGEAGDARGKLVAQLRRRLARGLGIGAFRARREQAEMARERVQGRLLVVQLDARRLADPRDLRDRRRGIVGELVAGKEGHALAVPGRVVADVGEGDAREFLEHAVGREELAPPPRRERALDRPGDLGLVQPALGAARARGAGEADAPTRLLRVERLQIFADEAPPLLVHRRPLRPAPRKPKPGGGGRRARSASWRFPIICLRQATFHFPYPGARAMIPKPVVILRGPEDDAPSEPAMKFRLTYQGELRPTQRDPEGDQRNPLAVHKQEIRRQFHRQLKQFWALDRFLSTHAVEKQYWGGEAIFGPYGADGRIAFSEAIAFQFREFGYRFVPLVMDKFSLLCSLNILFLRRDPPGSALSAGDIDNRIKTIIDALRRPRNQTELVGADAIPRANEDPFFCLLEDDKQVSHFACETDMLLDPPTGNEADIREARVIITVELRPYYVNLFNLSFA